MNKCTCGAKTLDHSIYCSGDFYIDPLSQGKYQPKQDFEKTCASCFMVLTKSLFAHNSEVCYECR
jgi:hypothetical protein